MNARLPPIQFALFQVVYTFYLRKFLRQAVQQQVSVTPVVMLCMLPAPWKKNLHPQGQEDDEPSRRRHRKRDDKGGIYYLFL